MGAGDLRTKMTFYAVPTDDTQGGGFGGGSGTPEARFDTDGQLTPRFGTEEVMAARLAGRQPYTYRVRSDSNTRQVTPEWFCKDRDGKQYNVRAVADPDQRRAWLDMLIESGVAA
jgi:hypothetical protein